MRKISKAQLTKINTFYSSLESGKRFAMPKFANDNVIENIINEKNELDNLRDIHETRIKTALHNMTINNVVPVQMTDSWENDTINFITQNNIHEIITKWIIRKNASNPKHPNNTVCLDIIKSHYSQEIYKDLTQEVFLKIYELIKEENCSYDYNNKLVFGYYTTNKGDDKPCFYKLFQCVENYLYANTTHKKSKTLYVIDAYTESNDDGSKSYYENYISANTDNANYQKYLAKLAINPLETLAQNDFIKIYYNHLKSEYPKLYKDMTALLAGLFQGYNYNEIADKNGITERRVKYLMPILKKDMKEFYTEYHSENKGTGIIPVNPYTGKYVYEPKQPKKKLVSNTSSINNIDLYRYELRRVQELNKPIFNTPSIPQNVLTNISGYIPNNETINFNSLYHVFDKHDLQLKTINEKGETVFTYKIRGDWKTFVKSEKIETL